MFRRDGVILLFGTAIDQTYSLLPISGEKNSGVT
jgi:hypothetical protein